MDEAWSRRNGWIQAVLLALGGIAACWAALSASTRVDDGADGGGAPALWLLALAFASFVAAVWVIAQGHIRRLFEGPTSSVSSAAPGWYEVRASETTWMWWDGQAWRDPPPE
jgi:hypothetical protein